MSQEEIDNLREQVAQCPDHAEKVPLLEAAVRASDAIGNDELSYELRVELIESATWSNQYDRALVAFSWCLSRHDQVNSPISQWSLLWRFKWVLQNITYMPNVSCEQIERLEDDMQMRLDAEGYNRRAVEYIRFLNRARMGQLETAAGHYRKWKLTSRDPMADCRACEYDSEVEYFLHRGDNEKALSIARKLVDGELGGCREVPERPFGRIIRLLLRCDLIDEAKERQKAGISLLAGKHQFLRYIAEHVLLLARTKQYSRALRLIDKHLRSAAQMVDSDAQLLFFHAVSLSLESMTADSYGPVQLRLADSHPAFDTSGTYQPGELSTWYLREATKLSDAFDKRNQNDSYTRLMAESRRLVGL